MISEDLRRSYLQRAQALEDSVRRLLHELLIHLSPEHRKERGRDVRSRIELLFASLEEAILLDGNDPELMDTVRVDRVRRLSDEMIAHRAELDRMRRDALRATEHIDLDRRRLRADQLARELDIELEG